MMLTMPGQETTWKTKKALVIGGTGGIGLSCTHTLLDLGCQVTALGRPKSRPELAGVQGLSVVSMEIRTPEQTIAQLQDETGPLTQWDILICAFGPYLHGPLTLAAPGDWQHITLLNLALPGALVSAVLPGMMERRFGRILLFGGTGADRINGYRQTAVYQAAKAGLGVLAKSVSSQAAEFGVSCNVICPGYIATEYYSPGLLAQARRHLPQGEPGKPEDLDELIRLLVKNPANLLNGAIISAGQGL